MATSTAPVCMVIADDAAVQEFMTASLQSAGLKALPLAGLGPMKAVLEKESVSGILLEMATWMRAAQPERLAARETLEIFPSAKFRVASGQVLIIGRSLADFLGECRGSDPRRLRSSPRRQKSYPVLVSRESTLEDAERSATFDVSDGGCFVWSSRDWAIGECVHLQFLSEESPLAGHVRFWHPWGKGDRTPGIGIQFEVRRVDP